MKRTSILFCLLFAITAIFITPAAKAQVNTSDSLALVDFYNSTNGPNWYHHTNWLTTNPVSTWYGITVTGSRVMKFVLTVNGLDGALPASIGNLTSLTLLNLNSNQLTGAIPAEIGNLINLTYLNLYNNLISGSIPAEIGNLTNLTLLRLGANFHISGSIPSSIGNLSKLTDLELENNQLSGAIPSSIGNLTSLDTLYLAINLLSGTIPSNFGNLTSLTDLELYNNQLTGAIPSTLGNLTKLGQLLLNNNQLSGAIPSSLSNLLNLFYLNLADNQLSGTIPATLGNLPNLYDLALADNQLSGTIPATLGNLPNLGILYLNNNQLSGTIPSTLGNIPNLNGLYLKNNHLSGTVPASFKKLTGLLYFDISYNQLSKFGDASLFKNNAKVKGNVNNNLFTFDGLQLIAKTKNQKIVYAPQDTILPIHKRGNTLSLSAGGSLSNNTYTWYKAGSTNSTTIKGDSTFHPTQNGKYYAQVTNSVATHLTLYTDTISYTKVLAQTQSSVANIAAVKALNNHFSIYPNPAKDLIHIQTNGTATVILTNSAGKILLSKTINNSDAINVSSYANGIYYMQNKTTGETQKIIIVH